MAITITNMLPHRAGAANTTYMFRTPNTGNKAKATRAKQVLVVTVAGALLCALIITWLALGRDSAE